MTEPMDPEDLDGIANMFAGDERIEALLAAHDHWEAKAKRLAQTLGDAVRRGRSGLALDGCFRRDAPPLMPLILAPPQHVIDAAVKKACAAPCVKSRRGVAVFSPLSGTIEAVGHNAPPPGFACAGKYEGAVGLSEACKGACGKICEHAEVAALRQLGGAYELELVHVKVVDGELVASGPPSCWQCSKAILADGRIRGVWLRHEDDWRRYDVAEFHRRTLETNELPSIEGTPECDGLDGIANMRGSGPALSGMIGPMDPERLADLRAASDKGGCAYSSLTVQTLLADRDHWEVEAKRLAADLDAATREVTSMSSEEHGEPLAPRCAELGECRRAYEGPMPGCAGTCLDLGRVAKLEVIILADGQLVGRSSNPDIWQLALSLLIDARKP